MEHPDPSSPGSVTTKAIRVNPPLIMSLKEAAAFIGVSVRKLRTDLKARRISYIRLGGKILVRRDALMAALEKLEVQSV
ncbi:MAG TPA: helix-turn-helix domain-containing protein [Terriglobales bacterium]|nr:helix-turn-helix domain-containing protein [Terriglobales bacterium]